MVPRPHLLNLYRYAFLFLPNSFFFLASAIPAIPSMEAPISAIHSQAWELSPVEADLEISAAVTDTFSVVSA